MFRDAFRRARVSRVRRTPKGSTADGLLGVGHPVDRDLRCRGGDRSRRQGMAIRSDQRVRDPRFQFRPQEALRAPPSKDYLWLHAVNDGRRQVVISTLALEIAERARVTPELVEELVHGTRRSTNSVQNKPLMPGEEVRIRFDVKALRAFLRQLERKGPVRLRGVLEDTSEKHVLHSLV